MMVGMRQARSSRWNADDDALLRAMAQAGKSLTIMAVKLNRPMSAIRSRAQNLQVHIAGSDIGERRKRNA